MAVQPKRPDTNAGPNVTPAPHKAAPFVVTDKSGWPHPERASGYGENRYSGPTSLAVGQAIKADLDTAAPAGDPVLAAVIAGGSGAVAADPAQIDREHKLTSRGSVKPHPDMKNANSNGAPAGKVR